MRRLTSLALFSAVLVLSCQQDQQSPTTPILGTPSAHILDGAHGGNDHFYFLPELVESPTYFGTFNPYLKPEIRLCALEVTQDELPLPAGSLAPPCATPGRDELLFSSDDVSMGGDHYGAVWHSRDSDLSTDSLYRISYWVGTTSLGFRDMAPKATPQDVPSNPKGDDFYAFNDDNTIHIKARIEYGALCLGEGTCGECQFPTNGSAGNNPDFFPGDPTDRVCNADEGLGVLVPEGQLPEDVTVIIERLNCEDNANSYGQVEFFKDFDAPQYPGCFTVRSEPPVTVPIEYITVATCVLLPSSGPLPNENAMHIGRSADHTVANPVVVLNNVAADFIDCDAFEMASLSPVQRLARRAWEKIGLGKPLYAGHVGRGGATPNFSDYAWVWQPQMDFGSAEHQTALAGTVVSDPPVVNVTDEFNTPVFGARVWYNLTQNQGDGSVTVAVPIETDLNGDAAVSAWTLGNTPGLNILEASGFGLGVKGEKWSNSPLADGREGTGPWSHSTVDVIPDHNLDPIPFGTGTLEFTATGCSPGVGSANVDGDFDAGEWDCAVSESFMANLSGGSWPATIYWMVDPSGSDLYMALKVDRSDTKYKANILTIYLDDDGDGLSADDDVINLDGQEAIGSQFTDQHVVTKCIKGQSFCGKLDDSEQGDGYFKVVNDNGNLFYFYEVVKPLTNDVNGQDVDTSLGLRYFIALRYGKGAQGGAYFPDYNSWNDPN